MQYKSNHVRKVLKSKIAEFISRDHLCCNKHDLFGVIVDTFLNFYVYTWIKNINKIKGMDTKTINNPIKKCAFERYKKFKLKKDKIAQVKKLVP